MLDSRADDVGSFAVQNLFHYTPRLKNANIEVVLTLIRTF